MSGSSAHIELSPGDAVFVHQAFTCCPYAAMITVRIHDFFEKNGCPVTDHPEDASLSVVNTCGFNASRSEQALRAIRVIRKRAPTRPIVVCGCLTRIERDRVREALSDTPAYRMVGPAEHDEFDRILPHASTPFDQIPANLYKDRYSSKDPRFGLFQVLVSTGCTGKCTYCVIRKAKGSVTSRPIADIVREVQRGREDGHRDIFLIGDDISSYGEDLDTDVSDLLSALVESTEDTLMSAEAFEPTRFIRHLDRLLPIFATGRFSWIVFPVQSGSDRILQDMGRRYTVAEIERTVQELRRSAPSMILSTDFIYGFAGETEEEFEASLNLASLFDYSNFNDYEPRPGTPPVTVSEEQMKRRRERVQEYLRQQGGQVNVLTRNRAVPCDTRGTDPDFMVADTPPTRWAVEHCRRIAQTLEAKDATFPAGWSVQRVAEDRDGVLVVLGDGDPDHQMTLQLNRRTGEKPCMARSDLYDICLVSDDRLTGLDPDRMQALATILTILGGRS